MTGIPNGSFMSFYSSGGVGYISIGSECFKVRIELVRLSNCILRVTSFLNISSL